MKKNVPTVSIVLIGYNSRKFLQSCLKSVEKQTMKNIETLFIDNASSDESIAFVRQHFPWVKTIANTQNLGYGIAANQGIHATNSKHVMILNPDIILNPDYVEKIIQTLEKDKKIGAITGKVLKYDFDKNEPTSAIDTTGLYCYRNRRIIDRGQGMIDNGQYDEPEEVFGVSGAVPVYRREALEDIKISIQPFSEKSKTLAPILEYFDGDFFMYKEDIDLSWRMRLRGWKCYYEPKAICYHGRGTGVLKRFTHWEVYKGRRTLSRFQKHYAYKNQRLMQIKNELWPNLFRDALWIASKECIIFCYVLFKEPYLLKAMWQGLKQLPSALRKRQQIMARRTVNAQEIGYWLSGKAKQ